MSRDWSCIGEWIWGRGDRGCPKARQMLGGHSSAWGGNAAACIIIKTRELHLEAAAEREEGTDTRGGQGTIYICRNICTKGVRRNRGALVTTKEVKMTKFELTWRLTLILSIGWLQRSEVPNTRWMVKLDQLTGKSQLVARCLQDAAIMTKWRPSQAYPTLPPSEGSLRLTNHDYLWRGAGTWSHDH